MCDTGRKKSSASKKKVRDTKKDSYLHGGPSGIKLITVPVYD